MTRLGVVKETSGDLAEISAALRSPCGSCSERQSCGMTFTVGSMENQPADVTAENRLGAKPGDTVQIDFPGHTELKLSLLVWMVPVVGLIGGAAAGANLAAHLHLGEDLAALIGAGVGIASSYILLRRIDRRAKNKGRLLPRVVKIVDPSDCPEHEPSPSS